ncbi:hypothetical protein [Streptomyces erythrochromogenes]|uniref:hypothetical protein n=1 Tax=Streptomyces erythrochromogenes TaxID=285574 RepID=UPI003805AF8B
MRVQGARVGGHHPAPADGAGVVAGDRLHDLLVQTGPVLAAAQDVGEVAAGFSEEVVVHERAAHHEHHGGDVDGRQGDVDDRTHPRPDRFGGGSGPLGEPVDGAGAECGDG